MRKCFICKKKGEPADMFIDGLKATCRTPECMTDYSLWKLDKQKKIKQKSDNKKHREAKAKLNDTIPRWTKKAQVAFNKYIRLRDRNLPCVSCGKNEAEVIKDMRGVTCGGVWDAGHWRSRGSCPELRFCETNCFKQCKKCNGGSGKYGRKEALVKDSFKSEVRRRIGRAQLEWVNGPHEPKRYRVEDLKEIEALYKERVKEIENNRSQET